MENVILEERMTRELLRLICCLRYYSGNDFKHKLNLFYIILVYIFLFVVVLQGIVLAFITDDLIEKVESIHYTLIIIIVITYISNELYHNSNLNKATELMMFAQDNFNKNNDNRKQIHIKIHCNAMKSNRIFCFLMSGSCLGYLLFAPLRQIFNEEEQTNRKLPVPLYIPLDTNRNIGYTIGMIWEAVTLFFLCGVATSVHQSFIGIMGRLRGELQLLNKSLEKIQTRAARNFIPLSHSINCSEPIFKALLFVSLKENIIHHQLLVRYYNQTKYYLGTILVLFIFLSSIILAAVGFLMTSPDSHMEDIIKFLAIVSAELFFVYQLCYEGELVAEESEHTFNTLLSMPWYLSGREFRNSLIIMQCGTLKPIRLTTSIFNVPAALETFNSVITTAFQYFNLLRKFRNV